MREMKLNTYTSTSPATFVYIHIIATSFIIVATQPPHIISYETETDKSDWPPAPTTTPEASLSLSSSSELPYTHHQQQQQQQQSSSAPTTENGDVNFYQVSQENKKIFNEQVKSQLLKVLGLKEVPDKPKSKKNNKAYVPRAMLEEYKQWRDSVREYIPEDRDFYGKINIDDLDYQDHEPVWSEIPNRLKRQDIEVDMGQDNEATRRLHVKRSAKHLVFVTTQTEPEDVRPALEHLLPPYSRSPDKQRQFISVHLRFNLSQEYYVNPMKVDQLESAELILSRERVHNKNKARYQRIYILHIMDYDKHNDPITRIHDSRRIDTEDLSQLKFDVYNIIKYWLLNPTKNYGIIVRVTNDDKNYEQKQNSNASTIIDDDDNNNDNNNSTNNNDSVVLEHVRLKREFQSTSESDDSWLRKRPSLIIANSVVNQDNQNTGGSRIARSSATGSSGPSQKNRARGKNARQVDKCAMRTLSINFDDMGWSNWIIAPTAYLANYCAGDCSFPLIDQQNATNHAIIQSIYHSVGRLTPRSCCAPTKLGKMAILYQLDGTVQMRHYEDMIVESCGCL